MGKDDKGNPRIFAHCLQSDYLFKFVKLEDIDDFCLFHNDGPVKSINGIDPFEYISNLDFLFLDKIFNT